MKKSELEDIISQDLTELWAALNPDEKKYVLEGFTVHRYKKNQIIYGITKISQNGIR